MYNETKLLKLIEEIENVRIMLDNLISERQYNLLDPEVIKLSQELDKILSQYYSLKW